jgi:hypothetical protein
MDEAVASYVAALAIKPDYAKAHSNLARIIHGRLEFVGERRLTC